MSKDIQNLDNLFGITSGEPKKNKEVNIKKNNDIENLNNIFGINEDISKKVDNKYNTSFDKAQLNLNTDLTNRDYISEYDDPFNTDNGLTDLNELRANRQSWESKATTGLGRVGVKVVAEVAKMPGMIGGAIAAPFAEEGEGWDTFVNNSWIKTINQMNEDINSEALPVYVKKAVSEGNLWDNISSIDFWATDGADGIGYIASMMVPGAVLKGLGAGKYLSQLRGLKGVISAQKADVITATVANTLFEAGAEAGNAMENFQKDMDTKLANGEISPEQYEEMKLQKARLGRDIFLSNAVILAGPNALQANMLWGKGINKTMSKLVDGGDGVLAKTVVEPKLYQKVLNRTGDVLKATGSEGLWEEGMQMSVENMFTKSAKKGQLTDNPFNDFNISELGDSYLDTISSTEGQKAMFLGAFLGGGMQAYSGAKTDIADRKSTQSLLDAGNNAIDAFYKTMQKDVYNKDGKINSEKAKEKFEAFGRVEQLNIMYNQAVQKQDKEALEKLRDLAATQLAYGFIMNEDLGLEVLQEHLNASSQFDEIVQREQEAGNKTSKKDIIDNVMSKAKVLEKAYRNFNDFAPSLVNPTLNENQTQEDIVNFTNTLRGNYISNKANINLNKNTLSELKKKRQNILEDLDLNSELVVGDETIQEQEQNDERLKQVTEDIKEVETNLNRLKKLDRNFWNTEHIQKAFNRSTKEKKQLEKETSSEVVENNDAVLEQINNTTSHKELDDIKSDNKIIQNKIQDRKKELQEEELVKREAEIQSQKESENLENETNSLDLDLLKENSKDLKKGETIVNPITGEIETVEDITKNSITLNGKTYEFEPELSDNNSSSDIEIKSINAVPEGTSKTDAKTPGVGNKEYTDYLQEIRDKKGDVVTFELNLNNLNNETRKAIEMYNAGKISENRDFLINNLPITFIYNGKVKSFSAFPSKHPSALIFRTNVIDVLSQGYKLEDLSTIVSNQEVADFNNKKDAEGNPLKNNVLDIDYVKNELTKDTSKLTLYHINKNGQPVLVTDAKDTLDVSIKSRLENQKGQIFLVIKNYKGDNIPVKLNFNRLDNVKASSLARLYSEVLKNQDLLNQPLKALSLNEETKDLYDELIKIFESELKLINKSNPQLTNVNELIEVLVFENSFNDKKIIRKLDNDKNPYIEYNNKEYYLNSVEEIEELANDLRSKFHNVITITTDQNVNKSLNFQNPDYLKYLFENKILTTDLDTENGSFVVTSGNGKQGSELWIDSSIVVKNQKPSKPTTTSKPQQSNIEAKIKEVINNKNFIKLSEDGTHYINTKTGKKYKRVSNFISNDEEVDSNNSLIQSSLTIGTKVDELVRDFFADELKDLKEYNVSDIETVSKFLEQLTVIKTNFKNRDETVLANDIILYNDEIGVAGTVDLLTYDNQGNVRIYDMKTMRGDNFNQYYNEDSFNKYESTRYGKSKKEKHSEQISLYRILLNNTHGLKAKTIGVMPIEISYSPGDTTTTVLNLLKGVQLPLLDKVKTAELKVLESENNLENNVQTKESFIEEKLQPFKDKIKEIIKGLEADESVKGPFYGVGSKLGNMIKLTTEVEYTQEGIIVNGALMPYKQLFSDVYGKSLENIWNSQKNSVSLQDKPKIVNKMDVKGTEENKELNQAYKDLTENDLSKKQKELSDVLEKNQKALSSSKNEILNKRLEDIISKTQTELNSVVEEIKKRKTC